MTTRRKLLLLAGYFPPVTYSTGSVRTWNIAKHLARLSWQVTVVTPDPALIRSRYVENAAQVAADLQHEGIRRITTGFRWPDLSPGLFNYPLRGPRWFVGGIFRRLTRYFDIDHWSGWNPIAGKACAGLTSEDVDVILVSGAPHIAFRLAQRLSHRLHRPYVLDYRDLWTSNPHQPAGRPSTIRLETQVLQDSAAITVISPSIAAVLAQHYEVSSKLHVITNGYDAEAMDKIKPHSFEHFAIVYAGGVFPPKRSLTPLMAALRQLTDRKWMIHYFGENEDVVRAEANQSNLQDRVVIHGQVPRAKSLEAVRGANVSVVVTTVVEPATLEDKGVVTGKIFESIGLGTPQLIIAPSGSDVEAIVETAGLGRCFPASDTTGIAAYLVDLMNGHAPEARKTKAFAWTNLGQQMSDVLREATNRQT